MRYMYKGARPRVAAGAFIAESTTLTGDVEVGEHSSIWFGAVLRGDVAPIRIGRSTSIQDNCTVHGIPDVPVVVGDRVTVGHGAVLHACRIGDDCLIGMNAAVLTGVEVGEGSIIGAGTVVTEGRRIPPRSLVLGIPGKVIRETTKEDLGKITYAAKEYEVLAADYLREGAGDDADEED